MIYNQFYSFIQESQRKDLESGLSEGLKPCDRDGSVIKDDKNVGN